MNCAWLLGDFTLFPTRVNKDTIAASLWYIIHISNIYFVHQAIQKMARNQKCALATFLALLILLLDISNFNYKLYIWFIFIHWFIIFIYWNSTIFCWKLFVRPSSAKKRKKVMKIRMSAIIKSKFIDVSYTTCLIIYIYISYIKNNPCMDETCVMACEKDVSR